MKVLQITVLIIVCKKNVYSNRLLQCYFWLDIYLKK